MASSKRTETISAASATSPAATASTMARRRDEGRTAAHPATMTDIQRLRFEATINGRYHTSRQGWYATMHRWAMFFVVIGGTAAVAEAIGQGTKYSWLVALIPTVAGTVDLVFDFGGRSAEHARLKERSYEVVAEVDQSIDTPEIICKRGWAALARIYMQETKTMRVVHALAYNDTKEGTEEGVHDELLVVPWWARWTRHLFAFDGLRIQSAKEIHGAT